MLSSVSTLLLCLVICRSVVYQNGIGVMNIQLAEGYKNGEKGGKGAWVLTVGAGGPNSEDGVGAGAREKKDAVMNMSMKRRRDKRGRDIR